MKHFVLILCILATSFANSSSSNVSNAKKLEVITLNAGYARASIFNLVPCIYRRVKVLARVIDQKLNADKGHKAILFQEFYNRSAFKKISKIAARYNYKLFPDNFSELKNNGILILTNLNVIKHEWEPFKTTKYPGIQRGIRYIHSTNTNGKELIIGNTHTTYSSKSKVEKAHEKHLNQVVESIRDKSQSNLDIVLGSDLNIGFNYAFKQQIYDPVKEIWEPFYQELQQAGMRELTYKNPSWDEQKNFFASKPSLFARLFATTNGEWDEKSAHIDHLFVSTNVRASNTSVTFDKLYSSKTSCRGLKEFFISDHFAIKTQIDL